jgi:hypothetical protein
VPFRYPYKARPPNRKVAAMTPLLSWRQSIVIGRIPLPEGNVIRVDQFDTFEDEKAQLNVSMMQSRTRLINIGLLRIRFSF